MNISKLWRYSVGAASSRVFGLRSGASDSIPGLDRVRSDDGYPAAARPALKASGFGGAVYRNESSAGAGVMSWA